jgi:NADP-dependent 3-hydroxy acid dehydrogenase YdfG/acyl carrier protein
MRDGHLLLSTLPRRSATSASEHALRTLGQLWVRGAELEWSGLYAGQQRRRVSLPTYPFERARHWIDATQPLAPRAPQTVGTGPYVQTWKRIHSGPARAPAQSLTGVWVIRADRVETARRFGAAITDLGGTPALGGAVSESVEGVVYALEDHTDPVAGVCDLSRILRTIEDSPHGPPRYFVLLTTGVFDVSGEETLDLGHAPLAGYMRCIARELPETRCLLVDVGAARLDPRFPQRVLTDLLSTDGEPILAYRGNATWTAGFEPWPMLASNDETGLPCGAYLVVGGTGRLGLEAAQTICEMLEGKSAHLYLVARSPVPIDSDAFGRIDALRTASCQVEVRQVDATDAEGMRHLVDEIVEQHGSVAGVVYAAGSLDLTGFAPTSRITPDVCDVHFRPRVNGLAALRDALRDRSPGFCVVFSSVSSVLGGVSFGAYAAGNAFSDEMCLQLLRDEGLRWLSVGWDAWRFPDEPETSARLDTSGFEPTVGRALLRGILAAHQRDGWGGAVYCADDLAARHQRWAQLAWQCELHQDTPTRAMAEPEGDARGQLESIWHAVLGTRVVRDADDFFALGGSSLLALQLLAALRQRAAVDLSLAELLEHSTFGQLAALVSSHIGADMPEAPIPRVDPAHLHPLSRQQRGMWLAEQVNEHARGAFHVSEALSLEGPLDVGALVESFRALADRHEMLRARFVARDGIPFQTVDASSALDIRVQPLMSTDEPSFTHIVEHEFSRPFDLEQGCLVRVSILQDSPTRHILVFVAHHLVLDDWSIGTLLQELRELYAARLEGRDPDLPTLSVGYLDYSAWQASQSSQATRIDLDGYWSERLRGLPGVDPIPLDRPRPRTRTYRGGQVRTHVPVEQLQRVRAVAEERSTTPFMVLLALFRCVVDALAQADDLIVGTPTAGRDDSRLEHVVGYFVNAVPLRLGMPLEGTFSDLLVHIREIVFDAFAHQSEPSGAVLPIWFTLLTHTAEGQLAPGVTMSPLAIGSRPARFDLALILEPDGGGLRGTVEYSTDVFSETTGNLVAELFERACECVLQRPEAPLADVRPELRAIVAERRARDASALDAGARLSLASVRRRALTSS